jgi:sulfide:quinone oxidoreductase
VPGALTFSGDGERARFAELLGELGRRGRKRLAFVVPNQATWSIAAYELALLTAAECRTRRLSGVELFLVTHESAPLELFGADASQLVAARLSEAGVAVRLDTVVTGFDGSELELAEDTPLPVDQAVALPALEVPLFPGLPQRERGFVVTDVHMQVSGLEDVWAAGDVTSFPLKQGGLAAQQADVAARAIAATAGAHVPLQTFQPVLRAALITGGALEFFRARVGEESAAEASAGRALWWPPAKLAGNYLGPLIARAAGRESPQQLVDVEPPSDPEVEHAGHDRARELVLAAADADARLGDFQAALRWLGLIERLDLVLPPEYVARRHEWRRELDPDAVPGAAARRIEPGFVSAAAALSDLQRRVGWLREIERRTEGEMRAHLSDLDAGLDHLLSLSRRQSGGA